MATMAHKSTSPTPVAVLRTHAGPQRPRSLLALVSCFLLAVTACEAAAPQGPSQLELSGPVPRKAATPAEAKLDSRLLAAVDRLRAGESPFPVRDGLERDAERRVLVDMRAEVTPGLLDAIEAAGGGVVNHFARYDAIRAWAPVAAFIPLAERDDVRGIRPADRAVTR